MSERGLRAIEELVDVAERVRGLKLKVAVPVMVQDPDAIAAYVDTQIDVEELARARSVYVSLGLLDPRLDVRELLLRLMAEQIVGYYDAKEARLVVREDVMRAMERDPDAVRSSDLMEARIVLVHEIVHALQAQHLGLREGIELERDTDADNAYRALIEGDAYLAMLGSTYEPGALPLSALTARPEFRQLLSEAFREAPLAGAELMRAPAIVRVPLLSAYVDGLAFAASLHADGGWARIDRAYADPPVSTEQILHPERFANGERPEAVRLAGIDAVVGSAGYTPLHEDTLGELELGVYLDQGATHDEDRRAADGWNGDRLYAFQPPPGNSGNAAVAWITTWGTDADAAEAADAANRVHGTLQSAQRDRSLVDRRGRLVLIARELPSDLHVRVRALLDPTAPRR